MPEFIVGNTSLIEMLNRACTFDAWKNINDQIAKGLITDMSFGPFNPFENPTIASNILYYSWKYGSCVLAIRFAKFIDWNDDRTYLYISDDMIRMFPEMVNWRLVFNNTAHSEELHFQFESKLHFDCICWWQKTENFIRRFIDKVNWENVEWHNRTESFINDFVEHVDWEYVEWEGRTSEFLDRHAARVQWDDVWFDLMPQWFIEKYERHISDQQWEAICDVNQDEEFLIKYFHKFSPQQMLWQEECPLIAYGTYCNIVDWPHLCRTRLLPESFLIQHAQYVNWDVASAYQKLSLDTIRKMETYINFYYLSFSKYLTYEIISEYKSKLDVNRQIKNLIQMEHEKKRLSTAIPPVCADMVFAYL